MTASMKITLTDDEEKLLAEIELEALALKDHIHAQKNADTVVALMTSLLGRKAIPAIRTAWFLDREHNAGGRGHSIQDLFDSNGIRSKEDLFRHPHFLTHVRYFIDGPRLPASAIAAFRAEVADRGMITSSDALPLAKAARTITGQHGLRPRDAAEEFYKLALELEVGTTYASTIREYVKKAH